MLFVLFSFLACTHAQSTLTCDEGELDVEELAAGASLTVPFDLTAGQFHVFEIESEPSNAGLIVTVNEGSGNCTSVVEIDGDESKETIQCSGTTTGSLMLTTTNAVTELDLEVECEEPLSCDEDIEFLLDAGQSQVVPVDIPAGATVTFEELCEDFTDFSLETADGTVICDPTICTAAGTEDCVVSNFSDTATLTFVGPATGGTGEVELEVECSNIPDEENGGGASPSDSNSTSSESSESNSVSASSESDSDALTSPESASASDDSGVASAEKSGKASSFGSMRSLEETMSNNLGWYLIGFVSFVLVANIAFCAWMWRRGKKAIAVLKNVEEEMEEHHHNNKYGEETVEMN